MLCKWEELPDNMRTDAVLPYYNTLDKKRISLCIKRAFDLFAGLILLILLFPLFLIIAFFIAADSNGGVFFKQVRITRYGREFNMYKFRTMVPNADKSGLLTTKNDSRITIVGHFLRKTRLDELPQLLNIIKGDMTFVGTRPEVGKYVKQYTNEMAATLLMPAGVTSEAAVMYKDEDALLENAQNADEIYMTKVLPAKMVYNLESLRHFNLLSELKTVLKTVFVVFRR